MQNKTKQQNPQNTPRHIIFKLQETEKKINLERRKREKYLTYGEANLKVISDFSEIMQRKGE